MPVRPPGILPGPGPAGADSAKGFRGAFFGFRLSYILWFLVSQVTYGAMDIFVTPYTSLGGMLFLQEAARARQGEATPQQEEQDSAPGPGVRPRAGPSDRPEEKIEKSKICLTNPPAGDIINLALREAETVTGAAPAARPYSGIV